MSFQKFSTVCERVSHLSQMTVISTIFSSRYIDEGTVSAHQCVFVYWLPLLTCTKLCDSLVQLKMLCTVCLQQTESFKKIKAVDQCNLELVQLDKTFSFWDLTLIFVSPLLGCHQKRTYGKLLHCKTYHGIFPEFSWKLPFMSLAVYVMVRRMWEAKASRPGIKASEELWFLH